jgi:hypothetical protein
MRVKHFRDTVKSAGHGAADSPQLRLEEPRSPRDTPPASDTQKHSRVTVGLFAQELLRTLHRWQSRNSDERGIP